MFAYEENDISSRLMKLMTRGKLFPTTFDAIISSRLLNPSSSSSIPKHKLIPRRIEWDGRNFRSKTRFVVWPTKSTPTCLEKGSVQLSVSRHDQGGAGTADKKSVTGEGRGRKVHATIHRMEKNIGRGGACRKEAKDYSVRRYSGWKRRKRGTLVDTGRTTTRNGCIQERTAEIYGFRSKFLARVRTPNNTRPPCPIDPGSRWIRPSKSCLVFPSFFFFLVFLLQRRAKAFSRIFFTFVAKLYRSVSLSTPFLR